MTYISGPMTGIKNLNFPAFNKAERFLRKRGDKVFNPACHSIEWGFDRADFLRLDIQVLLLCDKIYMLNGWKASKGALLEKHIAEELGIETEYQS